MLTQQELEKSPLFKDISYEEYCRMLTCFQAVQKSYRPEELVYDFTGPRQNAVGIVERGEASLIRIDEDGVSTVLEELGSGSVFGKNLAFAGSGGDSLEVVCRTGCDVLFIDYAHILKRCENACHHHSLLVQNMLQLMADKAQSLSERVDVLSRRSIRDKLLCYFRQLAEKRGGDSFVLPFSLSMLADYIATDRSAMMRELKRLREDGVVHSDGRQFTLHL
ncbi:Crp/Fnr family transcriptional regulator [Oscillibacter sp.]|uniref:Crp/Fnr family transcriptional regulator n=1 Tax=Oscillibacter sp. TaxID=1945593 RepID=UPI00262E7C36|nr:Crp/Fnr family transcriptional regulator [Oscillibacter sp.]MDD3347728.1 Crp/Fnr family transcriptional regulator [Oscillibacter sp.]